MSSESTIRILTYTCIAIPALFLFLENRVFEAGAIGWLILLITAIAIFESCIRYRRRKAIPSPPTTINPSNDSTEANVPAPSEKNLPTTSEYDMKSDQEWCPLSPKELIDYVSYEGSTSIAREQRSAMYKGKLLRVRGVLNEIDTFTLNDSYRIDLYDTLEHPWSWSLYAEMRSDQDEYVQSLRKGDQITVTGTIRSISNHISLEDSHIDHSTTIPHPKNLKEPLDKTNVPAWFVAALARSLSQIDSEGDTMLSRRLLDVLDRHINEMSEEVRFLGATEPRGEELRFLFTLLNRWCENPPTYPKPEES